MIILFLTSDCTSVFKLGSFCVLFSICNLFGCYCVIFAQAAQ